MKKSKTVKKRALSYLAAILAVLCAALYGCGTRAGEADGGNTITQTAEESGRAMRSYTQITQEKAKEMMLVTDGHIVIDVRRYDEYDEGHIPGAVCIPNEEIGDRMPEPLADLDQIILVYCRSGRRSKEAAQKLADIGYTNVYEFGGIIDWTGEIETEKHPG